MFWYILTPPYLRVLHVLAALGAQHGAVVAVARAQHHEHRGCRGPGHDACTVE